MESSENRSVLLLLDLPDSAFCGIDLLSFTTSSRFRGIKSLPQGWHFAFLSAHNALSLRHGVWFESSEVSGSWPELFVKRWDNATESLDLGSEDDHSRWRQNLSSIWQKGLTPYRQSAQGSLSDDENKKKKHDWRQLTSHINEELLSRVIGESIAVKDHWVLTSASSASRDEDDIPGLSENENPTGNTEELHFLPIDLKQTWRGGAVGRERTEAARDRSWALENLLVESRLNFGALLGELQFTFLMVLTLNNNSCLEHWKRIIELVLTCSALVKKNPEFFVEFLSLLQLQLQHCSDAEGALFDMADEANNLLKVLLTRFRHGLASIDGPEKIDVADELDELEEFLNKEHGWLSSDSTLKRGMLELEDGERVEMDMNDADEEQEHGDFAPTIVELTAAQARELGLPPSAALSLQQKHKLAEGSEHGYSDEEDNRDLDDMDDRY